MIVSESMMQPCPSLPAAEAGDVAALLVNHTEVARLYHACRLRLQALAGAVREQADHPRRANFAGPS